MLTFSGSFLGSCCDSLSLLSGLHCMLRCHCSGSEPVTLTANAQLE